MTIVILDDEELNAYLDGELPEARRAAVEAYLREHPEEARRLESYRADGAAIRKFFSSFDRAIPATPCASTARWRSIRAVSPRWAIAATLILAIGVGAGWFGRGPIDERGMESFARQAVAAHLMGTGAGAQSIAASSLDDLGRTISNALGVAVTLKDLDSTGYTITDARIVLQPKGRAVQLVMRGPSDDRLTIYFEGRPGATETPIRRIPGDGLTTLVWEDDNLACAITGTLEPHALEVVGRRIYAKLLDDARG